MPNITLKFRTINNPEQARSMGWTKNHLLLEVYVVGAWRSMLYVTAKQVKTIKWHEEVVRKLRTNGGLPNDTLVHQVEFMECVNG